MRQYPQEPVRARASFTTSSIVWRSPPRSKSKGARFWSRELGVSSHEAVLNAEASAAPRTTRRPGTKESAVSANCHAGKRSARPSRIAKRRPSLTIAWTVGRDRRRRSAIWSDVSAPPSIRSLRANRRCSLSILRNAKSRAAVRSFSATALRSVVRRVRKPSTSEFPTIALSSSRSCALWDRERCRGATAVPARLVAFGFCLETDWRAFLVPLRFMHVSYTEPRSS